jgi:hypothetical protein
VTRLWGEGAWTHDPDVALDAVHEARFLKLDVAKAAALLGWEPVTDFPQALAATMAWYAAAHREAAFNARAFTLGQIVAYEQAAAAKAVAWARPAAEGQRPLV